MGNLYTAQRASHIDRIGWRGGPGRSEMIWFLRDIRNVVIRRKPRAHHLSTENNKRNTSPITKT